MNTPSKVSAYSFHTKQNVVGAVSCSFTHRPYVYVFIESIQDLGYSGLGVFRTRRCFKRWYLGRMCLAWLCPNTKSQEAANKNMSGINHSMCVFTEKLISFYQKNPQICCFREHPQTAGKLFTAHVPPVS